MKKYLIELSILLSLMHSISCGISTQFSTKQKSEVNDSPSEQIQKTVDGAGKNGQIVDIIEEMVNDDENQNLETKDEGAANPGDLEIAPPNENLPPDITFVLSVYFEEEG